MVFDRLTLMARRRMFRHNVFSYIIMTYKNRVQDMFELLKDYDVGLRLKRSYLLHLLPPAFIPFFELIPKMFPRFGMVRGLFDRETVEWLAEQPEVIKIFSDELMWIQQYPTVPAESVFALPRMVGVKEFTTTLYTKHLIGADKANMKGFFGDGIKVAVLDTGPPLFHEAINRVVRDTVMPLQRNDSNGHSTWCLACIGGIRTRDDYLSRSIGKDVWTEGMAPRTDLIAIKCLGYVIGTGTTSQILEAIQKAVDYYRADVLNMSLGGEVSVENQEDDPYYHVFNEIVKEDKVIPVVAAGNEGPDEGTIGTPGWLESVLTVGAYDPIKGTVAEFSSRGPTPDGRIKPDTIAPGVNIHAPCVNLLDMAEDDLPQRYSPLSGTSMATPHVAGLIALMRQAHLTILGKQLTLDEIKLMLQQLGHEKTNYDGWGMITWDMYETWISTQYSIEI